MTNDIRTPQSNQRRSTLRTGGAVLWAIFVAIVVLAAGSRPVAAEGLQMPAAQSTPAPPIPVPGPSPVPLPTPVPCLLPPPTRYTDGKVHHKILFVSGWGLRQEDPVSQSGWDDIKAFLQSNPMARDMNLRDEDFLYFSYSGRYECNSQGHKDYTRPIYHPSDTTLVIGADYDSRARIVEEILNAFPEDRFDIVAHSNGGVVSLYWAATRLLSPIPQAIDRVNSITTLDSPLQGWPGLCNIKAVPIPVTAVLPNALDRVSVLTIRNIYDTVVRPEQATLPGVWRDIEDNYGGANANPCNTTAHGTVLQSNRVAGEIAAAVWPAHIMGPSTRNPVSAGSSTRPDEIDVTVTWPKSNELARQLSNKQIDNLLIAIGGRPARVLDIRDLAPVLRAYHLRILPPPQPTGGKFDLTVSIGKESDTQVQSVELSGPSKQPEPSSSTLTAFVTDVSGSMGDTWQGGIKIESAKAAATQLIDILERESQVGNVTHQAALVTFSTNASLNLSLTTDYARAREVVSGMQPTDWTNIGAGLQVANQELRNASPGSQKIIILLSDGMSNTGLEPDQIVAGPAREAGQAGTCIYTVGFGDPGALDEDLLRRIAAESKPGCGEYYYAPDASKLRSIYVRTRHKALGTIVGDFSGQIAHGEMKQLGPFDVPPRQGELHATLNWPGSRLDFQLTDPQGQRITQSYPGATLATYPDLVYWIIQRPKAGQWTAAALGVDVPEGVTEYDAVISTRAPTQQPGDGNGDGLCTEVDVQMALQMAVGKLSPDLILDVDGSGTVAEPDGLRILQWAVRDGQCGQ